MKTVITGLTVVLPNGDIIKTGSRTKKTSAGYNLTNLFIGSDGTLYTGITTNVQRRFKEHNSSKKGAKYTSSRRPVKLLGFYDVTIFC